MKVQTLKGFRDFLPKEARKRQYVIDKIRGVFESYGFEPLETPALEYKEILTGKYGEEEKLIYDFKTRGGDEVALRYDQTVPLARVVTQYQNDLPMPFKRYQIQNVWRGENTQKGRYREFLQCDADIVGISSPMADAEIIACALQAARKVFQNDKVFPRMRINDRAIFDDLKLSKKEISAIDKLDKKEQETLQLINQGIEPDRARWIVEQLQLSNAKPTERIKKIVRFLNRFGFTLEGVEYLFDPRLARGLDYYTSTIFELELMGPKENAPTVWTSKLSLGGGGRYDNLIGMFVGRDIPAVGFSFGFDRLVEALNELDLLSKIPEIIKVLVTAPSADLADESIKIANELRNKGINTELWLDATSDLEKQLKYADKKQIPYAVIVKEEGLELKNMKERTQEKKSIDEILQILR